MTDGLLRRVEVRGDLAGGQLAAPHQPEDLTAMLVGERPEDGIRGVGVIGRAAGCRTTAGCAHDGKDISAGARRLALRERLAAGEVGRRPVRVSGAGLDVGAKAGDEVIPAALAVAVALQSRGQAA